MLPYCFNAVDSRLSRFDLQRRSEDVDAMGSGLLLIGKVLNRNEASKVLLQVLLLSTAILYSYESSTDPVYTQGFTRLDLKLQNTIEEQEESSEERNPSESIETADVELGTETETSIERPDGEVEVSDVVMLSG